MNPIQNQLEYNSIFHINYKPITATSIDNNEGNLNEIIKKTNESKGWFSSRYCYYPQSIYIQFPYPVHLSQINLCMHEKMIPEKIQFFSYLPDNVNGFNINSINNYQDLNYNNFGFIKLEDNLKNDFKFREYRKIYVNTNALIIRLDFDKNYYNKFNIYQQVGLISAEFLGSRIKGLPNYYNEQLNNNFINEDIDPIALEKFNFFNDKLNKAMKEEKYSECKQLKDIIDQIRGLGIEIARLNKNKLNAVYIEDFDTAQELKLKVQNLRNQLDLIDYKKNNEIETIKEENESQINEEKKEEKKEEKNEEKKEENNQEENINNNFNQSYENSPPLNKVKPKIQFTEEDYKPYDEIVVPALRKKPNNENNEFDINENENNENENGNDIDKDKMDKFNLLIPFIGKDGVNQLLSNQVTIKEIGFGLLKGKLNDIFSSENVNDVLTLLLDLISSLLEEKNSITLLNTLDLIQELINYIQSNTQKINVKNLNYYLQDRFLTIILKKFGDSNPKLSNKAIELFKFLFSSSLYDYNGLVSSLIGIDIKNKDSIYYKTSNKIIMSKLLIIQYLLELLNPSNKDKLQQTIVKNIKKYILMNVSHSKSEIRKLSRLLIQKFINIYGENSILKDLNFIEQRELNKLKEEIPQLKDYIEQLIGRKEQNINNSISRSSNNINKSNSNINIIKSKSKSPEKKEQQKKEIPKKEVPKKEVPKKEIPKKETTKKETTKKEQSKKKEQKEEKCIFCQIDLKGIPMDKHLEKKCPMFTNCPKCQMNIEVKRLTRHCLDECKFKKDYKLCNRCKEAILINNYDKHIKENRCNPAKDIKSCNRCPLCHEDIPPTDKGFYQHLCVDCCYEQMRKLPKKEVGV